MDKNTLTGLLLIGLILIGFSYLNQQDDSSYSDKDTKVENNNTTDSLDNTTRVNLEAINSVKKDNYLENIPTNIQKDSILLKSYTDSINNFNKQVAKVAEEQKLKGLFGVFYKSGNGKKEYTTLENKNIIVTFSNKGGRIVNVKLKKYQTYDSYLNNKIIPLELVKENLSKQNLIIQNNNTTINTKDLFFKNNIIKNDSSQTLTYIANTEDSDKYLQFTYTIKQNSYNVDFQISYVNLQTDIDMSKTRLDWNIIGLNTEKLASDQRRMSCVMYRYYDEKRDYISELSSDEINLENTTNWIAFKHKFFSTGIIMDKQNINEGVLSQKQLENEDYTVDFNANIKLPAQQIINLEFFFTPNEYNLLKSYNNGMDDIIDHGWGIFGIVNKWFISPIFDILNNYALNMGLIIILVTLIVKLLTMPFIYKNYLSSAKMRVLKPEIEEINERMKNADALTRQQEVSKLYSQTGVNPMAGCLPMLIQMPIVIAALRFFPSSIDLRHARFLWAEDLSSFESILDLGFNIPFYGAHISLFALLMAASTFLYTKMNSGNMATPQQPGMPNMTFIMYLMPFMMLFFFNSYSSGLSFYYLCGNLMNIGIMWGIKTFMIDEDKIKAKLAENKKKPKKKSRFQQKMDELVKQQQQQASKNKKK